MPDDRPSTLILPRASVAFTAPAETPAWVPQALVACWWVLTVVAVLVTLRWPSTAAEQLYTWATIPFSLGPTLAAWSLAWHKRTDRGEARAWWCFAAGVTASFAGELLWFITWVRTGSAPSDGLADVIGLAFGPAILAAILLLPVRRAAGFHFLRLLLDAGLLTASTATILHGITVLWSPNLAVDPTSSRMLTLLIAVADGTALTALMLLWTRDRAGMPRMALRWLAFTLLVATLSDGWFAVSPVVELEAVPGFVQSSWYVFWAGVGSAAVLAHASAPPLRTDGDASVTLTRAPYLMGLAAYIMLVLIVASHRYEALYGVTAGVGVVTIVVLVRQWLAARDVSALLESQMRVEADARLAALVRHGSDMVTILDTDTTVRYASPSHLSIVGIPPSMLVGRKMSEEIFQDDLPAAQRGFSRLLAGTSTRESLIVRLRDGTGAWRWIEAVGTNLFHEPTVGGLVLNSRDITDRKQLEAQLIEQARRDPLTGLGNRRLFTDRVQHALERRQRQHHRTAVLFCDLDHFKLVNDTLGHSRGDALLIAVADRLRSIVRVGDTVARLGGDEFAVLLEDLDRESEADESADRILQALSRPFQLEDREVFVGASVGIAVARAGQGVDDLVTDADVAMYGAKARGRGRVVRFSAEMRASITERVELAADLRRALERDEFTLVYQPVVDLITGTISGAEALIRWMHPVHGLILPGRFIPLAEESELIEEIGRFVLRRGAADAALFRTVRESTTRMRVAVNLTARHLLSPSLERDVSEALTDAGISGSALAIELTESMLAANESVMAERLHALRAMDIRIALDDFGTGYSSLAYLRRFPIDVLKIDKGFMDDVSRQGPSDAVMQAIVAIGKGLGMRTIAEGVESAEQLAQLRSIGCSIAQGYFISRPLSADGLVQLLSTWDPAMFATPTSERVVPTY
jgi:diguanylate cyclase (GGDEF)-like protein/PAS domain S-box-containing protein